MAPADAERAPPTTTSNIDHGRALFRDPYLMEQSMLWANVGDVRTAPSPKLRGACPVCGSVVIARCGTQRVHHWAHLGERVCDHWWESETDWHRAWKQNFPHDWQEYVMHDDAGEKHIADVRTSDNVVIEFQHSHLPAEERTAREQFYRDMVWVVDGLRLARDLPRFLKGARDFRRIGQGIFEHPFPKELFPTPWLGATAPVLFDFGPGSMPSKDLVPSEAPLWCLLPQQGVQATVLRIARETFIRVANERPRTLLFLQVQEQRAQALAVQRQRADDERLRYFAAMLRAQRMRRRPYGRRWPKRL